jgi:hypothetical protein
MTLVDPGWQVLAMFRRGRFTLAELERWATKVNLGRASREAKRAIYLIVYRHQDGNCMLYIGSSFDAENRARDHSDQWERAKKGEKTRLHYQRAKDCVSQQIYDLWISSRRDTLIERERLEILEAIFICALGTHYFKVRSDRDDHVGDAGDSFSNCIYDTITGSVLTQLCQNIFNSEGFFGFEEPHSFLGVNYTNPLSGCVRVVSMSHLWMDETDLHPDIGMRVYRCGPI